MNNRDTIAQNEFGMDYDQLGSNEKEWVNDEIDNRNMSDMNTDPNLIMYIDDEEWEKEMGR